MKQLYTKSLMLFVAVGLTVLGSGCQDHTLDGRLDVALASTSRGIVMTGVAGKTLYFFGNDNVNGTSACVGGCITTWPAFYKENPALGSGLNAADFATITRSDGAKQTTYKGWPLHYYRNDVNPGDVAGEGIGGIWFVAKPDYTLMIGAGQLQGNDGNNYLSDYTLGTGRTVYFVDQTGRTVYRFTNDRKNKNNFTRADFSNNATWPLVEARTLGQIPSILNRADFTFTDVFGRSQLTYRGWPLYYFGADAGVRGSTKGVSVNRPGFWPLATTTTTEAVAP